MKKIISLLMVSSLVFLNFGFGLQLMGGENPNVSEQVDTNLYLAGGNVNVSAPINGDLTVAGGQLNISAPIQRDLIAAGGSVRVYSTIGGNVKVAGGDVFIDSVITGDLVVAGGTVTLSKNSIINGDLVAAGGTVNLYGNVNGKSYLNGGNFYLDGEIAGDVDMNAEKIDVGVNAKIGGNLNYSSKIQNQPLENIAAGTKNFKQLNIGERNRGSDFGKSFGGIMSLMMVGFMIFGLIFFFLGQNLFLSVGNIVRSNFWKSLGLGLLYYILMPVLVFVLMITVIGIPLGLFFLFVYLFSFVFSGFINVLVFSGWYIDKYLGGKSAKAWQKILVIMVSSIVFAMIGPFSILVSMVSFGAVMTKKMQIRKYISLS